MDIRLLDAYTSIEDYEEYSLPSSYSLSSVVFEFWWSNSLGSW